MRVCGECFIMIDDVLRMYFKGFTRAVNRVKYRLLATWKYSTANQLYDLLRSNSNRSKRALSKEYIQIGGYSGELKNVYLLL